MGGQQSKRSDAAFGVEVNVVPNEGYRVRVAPELEDILLRRNARNMQTMLQEAYAKGHEDAEKEFHLQRYAMENEFVKSVNDQLSAAQAAQQALLDQQVQELKAQVFEPPARKVYCKKQETDVMDCYKRGGNPLECSGVVQALAACATSTVENYVRAK